MHANKQVVLSVVLALQLAVVLPGSLWGAASSIDVDAEQHPADTSYSTSHSKRWLRITGIGCGLAGLGSYLWARQEHKEYNDLYGQYQAADYEYAREARWKCQEKYDSYIIKFRSAQVLAGLSVAVLFYGEFIHKRGRAPELSGNERPPRLAVSYGAKGKTTIQYAYRF